MKIKFYTLHTSLENGEKTEVFTTARAAHLTAIDLCTNDEQAKPWLRTLLDAHGWEGEAFDEAFEDAKQETMDQFSVEEHELQIPLASARVTSALAILVALHDEQPSMLTDADWQNARETMSEWAKGNETEEFLAIALQAIAALEKPDYDDQNATAAALRARLKMFTAPVS